VAKRISLKGKGADLFFGDYAPEPPAADQRAPDLSERDEPTPGNAVVHDESPAANGAEPIDSPATGPETRRSSIEPHPMPAGARSRDHASKQASNKRSEAESVEAIRKTVKTLGREVSFVRLTLEEKAALSEIVYAYKRQGIKTTENEINRIAINALLIDFHANGDTSMLARVLAALRA
jgi:hypothetical protein